MKSIGERLKYARDRKGFTQVYVKTRTGIHNKTLSGYENNVSTPDPVTISLLADLYEVSVDWLYGRGDTVEKRLKLSTDDQNVLDEFKTLNEEDKKLVLDLMERLKKEQH